MNRFFVTSVLSFQWLPTDLLHSYMYAYFLFEIIFIYKHPPCNQEHTAILAKLHSNECKGLLGNYTEPVAKMLIYSHE